MLIVIGLGGNALQPRGESADRHVLQARVAGAAAAIAAVADHGSIVVTHGNGPQVGARAVERPADGLDLLGAATEGELGYLIEQALRNRLPGREFATLLTEVEVDPADPAFAAPTKGIGPIYDEATARRVAAEAGWTVARDEGQGWRRVVASPEPRHILGLRAVAALLDAGITVICAGGGGIPAVRGPDGTLAGVDAVVDKDLTTAALAIALDADGLLLLTDVAAVETDHGTATARQLHKVSAVAARALALPAGSMGTKVEAACRFAEATGKVAGIGRLTDAADVLLGRAGTIVTAGDVETRWWA